VGWGCGGGGGPPPPTPGRPGGEGFDGDQQRDGGERGDGSGKDSCVAGEGVGCDGDNHAEPESYERPGAWVVTAESVGGDHDSASQNQAIDSEGPHVGEDSGLSVVGGELLLMCVGDHRCDDGDGEHPGSGCCASESSEAEFWF
jgi:hypothetical protein